MFEITKIKWAITAAAVDAGLSKRQQDKFRKEIRTSGGALSIVEARAGLRQGVLRDQNEAAAYVCSARSSFYVLHILLGPEGTAWRQKFEPLAELIEIVGIQALINFGVSPLVAPDAYDELVKGHSAKEARLDIDDHSPPSPMPEGDPSSQMSDTKKCAHVIELVSQLLEVQFHLGKARIGDEFNSRVLDHYGRGYVFGFIDTALASALIGMDENGMTVMRGVHNRLFGEDFGSDILDAAFEDQTNPKFNEGRTIGAKEFFDFNEEEKPAMSLALYLQQEDE